MSDVTRLVVRFYSTEEYDIYEDQVVITLMGTTPTGSFWCQVPRDASLGKRRREFKQRVLELMQDGEEPGYVELE